MTLTSVSAATTILANAMKLLDSVREQAKGSKDLALKENISNLYNDLLDLKAAHIRIEEENAELRRTIARAAEKPVPKIKQVGLANYYFVGIEGPFCQPCYSVNGRLVPLAPQNRYAGGIGRKCEVCNKVFFETNEVQQTWVEPFMGGGPDDWMR
ncbi:MAG: hypothetical protein WB919_11585 [Candidatus Sulfotelmatobacter sp.]